LRTRLESQIDAPDQLAIKQLRSYIATNLKQEFDRKIEQEAFQSELLKRKLDLLIEYVLRGVQMYVTAPVFFAEIFRSHEFDGPLTRDEIMKLCKKYQEAIEKIVPELSELRKKDQERLSQILSKSQDEAKAQQVAFLLTSDMPNEFDKAIDQKRIEEMKMLRNLNFLLMPPAETDLNGNTLLFPNKKYNIYPSPSNGTHTLELNLLAKDQLTIELLDANGKVLHVPFSGELQEGQHVQNYDWSKVEGNVFYYRITGQGGTETIKFLISR
jgi:hypothetical protein